MLYLTGDLHGHIDIRKLSAEFFPKGKDLTKDDYVVILGDFGLLWGKNEKSGKYWLNWLDKKPWTTLFIDGNHENFDMLDTLIDVPMFGSYVGKVNDSVFRLHRGHIYEIEGKSIFTLGGADSIDKGMREEGKSWWPGELLSCDDIDKAWGTLKEANWDVDYVFTHTCPNVLLHHHGIVAKPYSSSNKAYDPTTYHLKDIADQLLFKRWYYGHMHENKNLGFMGKSYTCLYEDIIQLGGKA